jgi:hypothetical protein
VSVSPYRAPYPPTQNGKQDRPGLITKADYTRLGRYGPSGELILPPYGVAALDYLWDDSSGRAHLHSNFELFLEARGALQLAANAFYDSAAGGWNRVDTAKAAFALVLRPDPTPQLEFYSVAAGANPIVWTGPATLTRAQVAQLLIDQAVLAAATSAYGANTLAKRDANGDLAGAAWNPINIAGGSAPAFSTNWANLGGWGTVQYRKGIDKSIHLRGSCTKSIAVVGSETVFTLPAGYCPSVQLSFPVAFFNGATPVLGGISITTGGVVQIYGGHNSHLSFAGVYFYTD